MDQRLHISQILANKSPSPSKSTSIHASSSVGVLADVAVPRPPVAFDQTPSVMCPIQPPLSVSTTTSLASQAHDANQAQPVSTLIQSHPSTVIPLPQTQQSSSSVITPANMPTNPTSTITIANPPAPVSSTLPTTPSMIWRPSQVQSSCLIQMPNVATADHTIFPIDASLFTGLSQLYGMIW